MKTSDKKLNWKIAAAAGALTGVTIGGFVLAAPNEPALTPTEVILDENEASVGRLSAPDGLYLVSFELQVAFED